MEKPGGRDQGLIKPKRTPAVRVAAEPAWDLGEAHWGRTQRSTSSRKRIKKIQSRLWDLLPVVRNHVYHPAFAGSFSLKAVLPALVPEMTYDGMEVADGTDAGLAWESLLRGGLDQSEREKTREALLDYCGQDTLALEHRGKAKDCQHFCENPALKELALGISNHMCSDPMSNAFADKDNYQCNREMFS